MLLEVDPAFHKTEGIGFEGGGTLAFNSNEKLYQGI